MKRNFWILLLVLVLAATLVVPVFAQDGDPPVTLPPEQSAAELMAFVILITGFLKQQFSLQGKWILLAGLLLTLLLGFLPEIQALFPAAAKIMDLIKLFLASAGAFDTVVNIGAKIATATITNKNVLNTDGSDLLPGG